MADILSIFMDQTCGTLIFTTKSLVETRRPHFCGSSPGVSPVPALIVSSVWWLYMVTWGQPRAIQMGKCAGYYMCMCTHRYVSICIIYICILMYSVYIYIDTATCTDPQNCSGLCTPKNGEIYKTNNMRYSKLQSCGWNDNQSSWFV